ncbi:N-acetyl sugar amidotransferase [Aliarcobacter cryaerophilus]|uniref:N-acetyl sugar amidotransferase n=1 Tax=Aliarcobacter cryaerophilus TaxID=28198 RepID=UPI003DA32704
MQNEIYRQCNRCIMDTTSDDTIVFDENGYCDYCNYTLKIKENTYFSNKVGQEKLNKLLDRLKSENKDKKYDCVMGISGGLDSSYLAYLGAVKWKLRILAVHIDDGFDTEISKRNIERISKFPNFDLKIIKPDEKQFNELTKAFMRAGVPNLATPQDNVLFASIYKFMRENGLRTFLSGGNFALECISVRGSTHNAFDLKNLKYIHKKFGKYPIDKLDFMSFLKKDIDTYLLKIETPMPLNYIEYNRDKALQELNDYCDFEYYGSKHLENDLTKFVQQYWFYKKFNVDKRKAHLSSMIMSDQLTRDEAQRLYKLPLYDEQDMKNTIEYILNKLDMSKEEFEKIMNETPKQHSEYPTSLYLNLRPKISKIIKKVLFR